MAEGEFLVSGYVVDADDDVVTDDAIFDISSAGTLVFLDTDTLKDDAIFGSGHVAIRGIVEVDGGLAIVGAIQLANSDMLTIDGGALVLGQASDDSVFARNNEGATLILSAANIVGAGASEFVNVGTISQTDDFSVIDANFYDRGGVITVGGTLDLESPGDVNRIVNGTIDGAGLFIADDGAVFSGTTTSVGTTETELADARVVGDLSITSSITNIGYLNLGGGAEVSIAANDAEVGLTGEVIGSGEIVIRGTDDGIFASHLLLVGDVALVNSAKTVFSSGLDDDFSFSTRSWTDDQITIENAGGATWIDEGAGSVFKPTAVTGTTVFLNNGSFIEDTSSGATFDMPVQNTGVMEAVAGILSDADQGASLVFNDALSGTGTVEVGAYNVVLNNSVDNNQKLNFDAEPSFAAAPTLILNDVQDFAASITGFGQDDQIEINSTTWHYQDYVGHLAGTGGLLMLANASGAAIGIRISGTYSADDIHATISGALTTITG